MFGNVTASIHCPYCSFRLEIDRGIVDGDIIFKNGSTTNIEQWLRSVGWKSRLKIGYSFEKFARCLREHPEAIRGMGQV